MHAQTHIHPTLPLQVRTYRNLAQLYKESKTGGNRERERSTVYTWGKNERWKCLLCMCVCHRVRVRAYIGFQSSKFFFTSVFCCPCFLMCVPICVLYICAHAYMYLCNSCLFCSMYVWQFVKVRMPIYVSLCMFVCERELNFIFFRVSLSVCVTINKKHIKIGTAIN